jgi:hypothetical protein
MAGKYKLEVTKTTLVDAISSGYGEIGELANEMSDWRDNLEDKFSQTQKYSDVGEAADTLADHRDEPSMPDIIEKALGTTELSVGISVPRSRRQSASRATRLDNAISHLQVAIEYLEEVKDDEAHPQELRDEIEGYCGELQQTVDNLDGAVEFPGMFG